MPVGYTYVTRNKEEGWVYGGMHMRSYFNLNYFGSGKAVKEHIKRNGKSGLTCELVEFYESYDELFIAEKMLIKYLRENYGHMCANVAKGGICGPAAESYIVKKNQYTERQLKRINYFPDKIKNIFLKFASGEKLTSEEKDIHFEYHCFLPD